MISLEQLQEWESRAKRHPEAAVVFGAQELIAEVKENRFDTNPDLLLILDKVPDHIWAMDSDGKIGLRFDDGDAGYVPLTVEQAQEVIETLQTMIHLMTLKK